MSYRKFFKPVNSVLPPSARSIDNASSYSTTASSLNSWLPEVYAGPPDRLQRYGVYDQMAMDHEISAALDTIADFGTEPSETTKQCFILAYNEDPTPSEVQILEKTLSQWIRLNKLNRRLWRIFRSTLVYGDQFFIRDPETYQLYWVDPAKVEKVMVNESDGKKIESYFVKDVDLNVQSLVATNNLNRLSNAQYGTNSIVFSPPMQGGTNYVSGGYGSAGTASYQNGGSLAVDAEHIVQVTLTDGMNAAWPFGLSILEQIYKVYKQKELLEDAVLIYRIQRAPERRVFFIDVGTMPPNKAQQYLERIKYEVQQKRIPGRTQDGSNVASSTYNPLCIALDTLIPLCDGRVLSAQNIISEYKDGKELYVFGKDEKYFTVPQKVVWAGVTRTNTNVVKISLSNNKEIITTPDHKFIDINGKEICASELEIGLQLMNTSSDVTVISVDAMSEKIDTCDITVSGDMHLFAVNAGVFIHNSILEDYYFSQSCLTLDTEIPLLDGRTLSLDEIIKEFDEGKENFTYSVDQKTFKLEPGKIKWAGVTRRNAELVEITLDNGEKIRVTPDHRFIMRDGSEVEAQFLQPFDSLMPLYLREAKTSPKQKGKPYLRYVDNSTEKLKWVHTAICGKAEAGKETEIHHIDFNSRNNNPTNLIEMKTEDHRQLHKDAGTYSIGKQWNSVEGRANLLKGIRAAYVDMSSERIKMLSERNTKNTSTVNSKRNTPESKAKLKKNAGICAAQKKMKYSTGMFSRVDELFNEGYDSVTKLNKILRIDDKFQSECKLANPNIKRDKDKQFFKPTDTTLNLIVRVAGYEKWGDYKIAKTGNSRFSNKSYHNHKVVSVKFLNVRENTGDLTIETKSGNHNFALSAGVYVHNSDGRGSKVEVLPGGDNLGCLSMDTKVKLLDGRDLTIFEIEQELKQNKELWTYSSHPITGEFAPGLISWAGATQKDARVLKITLDNNEEIVCTYDHKFPILGQGFVEAKDLYVGQSVSPVYTKTEQISEYKKADYEKTYDSSTKEWSYTHRLVMDFLKKVGQKNEYVFDEKFADEIKNVRHHIDHNRFNNAPDNLVWMNWHDHQKYHASKGLSKESQELGTIAAKAKMEYLKENDKDQYNTIINQQNIGREKWRKTLTTEDRTNINKNISNGLKEYISNLTDGEKTIKFEHLNKNSKMANARWLWLLENDASFRNVVCESMKNGIAKSKIDNVEKWAARSATITSANLERWKLDGYYDKVFEVQKIKYDVILYELLTKLYIKYIPKNKTIFSTIISTNVEFMEHYTSINKDTHSNINMSLFATRHIDQLLNCFNKNWNSFRIQHKKITPNDQLREMQILFNEHKPQSQDEFFKILNKKQIAHNTHFKVTKLFSECGIDNYNEFKEYANSVNHRIIKIDYLDEPMDVGTLSIDIDEKYHDYHTFALSAGIYTKNSIDDLKYFNNKMMRALGVPSSYLPTGPDDGTATMNDGRVGTAFIQEFRFSKIVTRYQQQIIECLNQEFKLFLKHRGVSIENSLFDITFTPAQSFSEYRQLELDSARINLFTALTDISFVSKRFILKRYMQWTEEEMVENERMWKEERNKLAGPASSTGMSGGMGGGGIDAGMGGMPGGSAASGLSDIGISSSGINDMSDGETGIEGEEGEEPPVSDDEVDNFGQ